MTTILTKIGWEDKNGNSLGTWTDRADLVNKKQIVVPQGVTVNSFRGDDEITGIRGTFADVLFYGLRRVGIYNESNGTINTNTGKDRITGDGNIGIYNESDGTINTNTGKDEITGYASQNRANDNNTIGILNDGTIITSNGDDNISGYAIGNFSGGIVNFSQLDTGNGDDTVTGDGTSGGVNNGAGGTINTGNDNDNIIGTSDKAWGVYNGGFGERGSSTIYTGNGNDRIIGSTTGNFGAGIASVLKGIINTGDDDDSIIGTGAIAGIVCTNNAIINTDNGNDIIIGIGNNNGIAVGGFSGSNSSKGIIRTGKGNDTIAGIGGIFNNAFSIINTGAGEDTVDALSGGFSGNGTIYLGSDDDFIRGFGGQTVDGGEGFDTARLGINFALDQITLNSTIASTSIDITFNSSTMFFTNVELFNFNGQELTLEQLQDMVQ